MGRPMAAGAGMIAASESVTVGFDPRITGIRDVDLEAVEIRQLVVWVVAEPGKEGVDQAVATGARRFLLYPVNGLQGDPEPHLVVVRGELGSEPEGLPVGFTVGVETSGFEGHRVARNGRFCGVHRWPDLTRPPRVRSSGPS